MSQLLVRRGARSRADDFVTVQQLLDRAEVTTAVALAASTAHAPLESDARDAATTAPVLRTGGRGPLRRWVVRLAALAILALLVGAGLFRATGGHWFVVRTPSMGVAAPVGSLVLTRPVDVTDVHVGDVLAFHPPTAPGETYTHRVVAVDAQGIHTRGDINGPVDPWALHQADLIGRVQFIAPAIGWLFRALPLLLLGCVVLWVITRLWVRPERRGPVQLLGVCLLWLVASVLLRPWVGVVQLATTTGPHGATITAVSTGLLPVQLTPVAGHSATGPIVLTDGEVGAVHLTGVPHGGSYRLAAALHLGWSGWLLFGLFCLTPLVLTLLAGIVLPRARRAGA